MPAWPDRLSPLGGDRRALEVLSSPAENDMIPRKLILPLLTVACLALMASILAAGTLSPDQGPLAQARPQPDGQPGFQFGLWADALSPATLEAPELTITRDQDDILVGWPLAAT